MIMNSVFTYVVIIIFSPLIGKLIKESLDYLKLLKKLKKCHTLLGVTSRLTPKEFEIWCSEYLSYLGYTNINILNNTCSTSENIICNKNNETIYVQCTQYPIDSSINISYIESLVGSMISNNINFGLIITTGSITDNIKQLLNKLPSSIKINIISKDDLNYPYEEYILQYN